MASQQNKTLHSVVMNFIPKRANPPIIKTSLPNLDKPLSNETIKLTYADVCNVVIKDADLQKPVESAKPLLKSTQLLEPVQKTLDNYVSVSVTKVQPKRLTKSAKVSAVRHELTVSPQTIYRHKHPQATISQPIKQSDTQPQPIKQADTQPQPIKHAQKSIVRHKSANAIVHHGKTFDDEPQIYRGKNPFHEITLKSRKSKKSRKSRKSKKSKKSKKSRKKDKDKRIRQTKPLSAGGNARDIISNDIQNMMLFF